MNPRFIIIALLAAAVIGGYVVSQQDTSSSVVRVKNEKLNELEARMVDIRILRAVELDVSILEDPFFLSLRPAAPSVATSVPPGRQNPFISF